MYCVTSSIKFVKSPKRTAQAVLFIFIFLLCPITNLALADCLNLITVSQATIQDENYILLNCTDRNWHERDLISVKSRRGDVVGILQLEKQVAPGEAKPAEIQQEVKRPKESQLGVPVDSENVRKLEGLASVGPENSTEAHDVASNGGKGTQGKISTQSVGESRLQSGEAVAQSPRISKAVNSKKGRYRDRQLKKVEDIKRSLAPRETTSLLKLISVREDRLLQKTDYFEKLDLVNGTSELLGTSYLWKTHVLPENTKNIYRPLLTQGETIGETAQTLWKNEYFFTVLGTIGYGITDTVSASTNLTGLLIGSPNAKLKNQFFRNVNQTWSVSLSMAQERNTSEKLFNVDLMWDSILTDSLVAHSLISAAVISFDSAKEVAALKSYGSSSIQTGYEYIFSNWSRFLIGPSYNIDQKAIGGYLGYVKIINNLHLQASLTTNNIRELKLSAKEGYFFILEAYWRW